MDGKNRKREALNKETLAMKKDRKLINIHRRKEAEENLKCYNDKEAGDEYLKMAEKRKRKPSKDMEKQKKLRKTFDEVQEKKKTSKSDSVVKEVNKKRFAEKVLSVYRETKKDKKLRKTREAGKMKTISVENKTKESLIKSEQLDEVIEEENTKHVYAKESKKRKSKKEINENTAKTKYACEKADKSFSELANEREQNFKQNEKKKKKVKRQQKEVKDTDKDKKPSEEGNGDCSHPALQYLHQWKRNRDCWRFQKVRQTWLLQNMYDRTKVPDEDFKVLIKYLQGLRGAARLKTITDAEKLIENEETANSDASICLDRVKQVVQEITEERVYLKVKSSRNFVE